MARAAHATLRLNPHPRLRRECGTRKFNGVRLGDVEGWATRPRHNELAASALKGGHEFLGTSRETVFLDNGRMPKS